MSPSLSVEPPGPPIDVAALRIDTPGVTDHIHLNNAGAALPPRAVLDRHVAHLHLEARIGGYRAASAVAEEVVRVRQSIGRLVGASADEVALHQSATDAWNTAVLSFLQRATAGDRVLVDRAVYGSHAITLLQAARRQGIEVVPIDNDVWGQVDPRDLERKVAHPRTRLVCVTHIPTSSGLVNPVEAVGEVCRAHAVDLVVDACQSVGHWPVDMARIGCSALAATGRKFLRGPRGTRFLVVRRDAFDRFEPVAPDLRAADWTGPTSFALRPDARRYESWERSIAATLGLGVAVDLALSLSVEALSRRIAALAHQLRTRLQDVPGVTVLDRGEVLCGICTFQVAGLAATEVARRLVAAGVTVSVTHATSAQLDLGGRGLPSVVRASVHAYNTEAELATAVERLVECCRA